VQRDVRSVRLSVSALYSHSTVVWTDRLSFLIFIILWVLFFCVGLLSGQLSVQLRCLCVQPNFAHFIRVDATVAGTASYWHLSCWMGIIPRFLFVNKIHRGLVATKVNFNKVFHLLLDSQRYGEFGFKTRLYLRQN